MEASKYIMSELEEISSDSSASDKKIDISIDDNFVNIVKEVTENDSFSTKEKIVNALKNVKTDFLVFVLKKYVKYSELFDELLREKYADFSYYDNAKDKFVSEGKEAALQNLIKFIALGESAEKSLSKKAILKKIKNIENEVKLNIDNKIGSFKADILVLKNQFKKTRASIMSDDSIDMKKKKMNELSLVTFAILNKRFNSELVMLLMILFFIAVTAGTSLSLGAIFSNID